MWFWSLSGKNIKSFYVRQNLHTHTHTHTHKHTHTHTWFIPFYFQRIDFFICRYICDYLIFIYFCILVIIGTKILLICFSSSIVVMTDKYTLEKDTHIRTHTYIHSVLNVVSSIVASACTCCKYEETAEWNCYLHLEPCRMILERVLAPRLILCFDRVRIASVQTQARTTRPVASMHFPWIFNHVNAYAKQNRSITPSYLYPLL